MKYLLIIICILLYINISYSENIITEYGKFSSAIDNIRRAKMYIEDMKLYYKEALKLQKNALKDSEEEDPEFYAIWLTVQNMNAAAELGYADKGIMRQVADFALRLNMFLKDPSISWNETMEYVKSACYLDKEVIPAFQERIKRLKNSKFRKNTFKAKLDELSSKLDDETFISTPTWTFPPAEPINHVVPNAPMEENPKMYVECDKSNVCRSTKQDFEFTDYVMEMKTHHLYPTTVATLHLDLPYKFAENLSNLAIERYHKFLKNEGDGQSLEEVNNQFFGIQAKSEEDQKEKRALTFWPELYRDSIEFKQLKRLARQACIEHIKRSPKTQDISSLEKSLSLVIWTAVYEGGTHHMVHTHEQSICSGVFYAKVPDNWQTPLVFSDPRGTHPMWMHKLYSKYGQKVEPEGPFQHQYYFYPKQGDIVLFPSYLPHGIPNHYSKDQRVVFAFNLEGPIDSWARLNV